MRYRRHPLEIGPLVFGLVFLGMVTAWALFELDMVSRADAAWILPTVLIAAGALGLVLAATKPRRTPTVGYAPAPAPAPPRRTDEPAGAVDDPHSEQTAVEDDTDTQTQMSYPDTPERHHD